MLPVLILPLSAVHGAKILANFANRAGLPLGRMATSDNGLLR